MTVGELREVLARYPADLPVHVNLMGCEGPLSVLREVCAATKKLTQWEPRHHPPHGMWTIVTERSVRTSTGRHVLLLGFRTPCAPSA